MSPRKRKKKASSHPTPWEGKVTALNHLHGGTYTYVAHGIVLDPPKLGRSFEFYAKPEGDEATEAVITGKVIELDHQGLTFAFKTSTTYYSLELLREWKPQVLVPSQGVSS